MAHYQGSPLEARDASGKACYGLSHLTRLDGFIIGFRIPAGKQGWTWGNATLGYSFRGLTEKERGGDRYPEDQGARAGKQHAERSLQDGRDSRSS